MKTRNDVPGIRPLRRLPFRRSARSLANLAGRVEASLKGGGFEALEARILLGGDHPSFMRPLLPNASGTLVDVSDGEGTDQGTIGTVGDDDLFRFVMPGNAGSTDFVTVLADTTSTGSGVNTRVEVYDRMGRVLVGPSVAGQEGFNNGVLSSGLASDGWGGFIGRAGETYFVRVIGEQLTTGEYQLRIDAQTDEFVVDLEPFEPDGDPNPNFGFGAMTGTLGPVDNLPGVFQQDEVVFHVNLDPGMVPDEFLEIMRTMASANAKIALDEMTGLPIDAVDTHLEVYDEEGNLLFSDIQGGRLTNAFGTWRSNPGDFVYIRVRADELVPPPAPVDPQVDQTAGEFNLVVQAVRRGIEIDTVMRLGPADIRGVLADGTDSNMWSFRAEGTGITFISVIGLQVGLVPPLPDPAITLYNEAGEVLAFADDSAGRDAVLEIRLVGGERYFLLVEGFDDDFGGGYGVFIEAHHTYDESQDIDDHVDTPPATLTPAERRRRFEEATPIRFDFENPFLAIDADGNPVRDRSWMISGSAKGRLYDAVSGTDTDLFQFNVPLDMLSDYGGDNDDAGTGLFLGGAFGVADPFDNVPVDAKGLSVWDANDYWWVGRQRDGQDRPFGFVDNQDTPGTAGAEIYAIMGVENNVIGNNNLPFLIVGGDFDLIVGYDPFGNPVALKNLAVWFFDPASGRYVWGNFPDLVDPNGAVRAFTVFDPAQFSVPGNGGDDLMFDDPADAMLVIGGDFTTLGGTTVNRIAGFNIAQGLVTFGRPVLNGPDSVGIPSGSVRALAVFDPSDPGEGREPQTDPPLSGVPDPYDPPSTLFIGGNFTADVLKVPGANPDMADSYAEVTGLLTWNGAAFGPPDFSANVADVSGVSGGAATVHAIHVFDAPDPDGGGPIEDPEPFLYVGGEFSQINGVAASNIAQFGAVAAQDPMAPDYTPMLEWHGVDINLSIPGPVFALTTYNRPDLNDTPLPPLLAIGGDFAIPTTTPNVFIENIVAWTGFGLNGTFGLGFNAPVRVLTTMSDQQELLIPPVPGVDDNREVLFAGGDFTEILLPDPPGPAPALGIAQFDVRLQFGQYVFQWFSMKSGVINADGSPGRVLALGVFDDQNPQFDNSELTWDRNDRIATRLNVSVSKPQDSFVNLFLRVYDSNFNVVYENDSVVENFPDPPGMIDPSLANPMRNMMFDGIEVWAGETYYIEIGHRAGTGGNGRYQVNVRADGIPAERDGFDTTDGVFPGTISTFVEVPDAGRFDQAQFNQFSLDGAGDDSTFRDARDDFFQNNVTGSTFDARFFERTPTFMDRIHSNDHGTIHSLFDSDLWAFRATGIGQNFVEVRLSTANLFETFAEGIDDPSTQIFPDTINAKEKTFSSFFDGRIRIFNNDFVEIGFNDFNPAVGGESDLGFTGTNADRTFFHRDPRVVFEVTGGEIFYVLVESGQLRNVTTDDMGAPDTSLVDWRMASGAYELMINAVPDLNVDGMDDHQNTFSDDLFEFVAQRSTPIPLDIDPNSPNNGRGFASGIIDHNPGNPDDSDVFQFIGAHTGIMKVTVSAAPGSPLAPAILISDSNLDSIATAAGAAGGSASTVFLAQRGDRFFISISGTGDSEGRYNIRIEAVDSQFNPITGVITDDHADVGTWVAESDFQNGLPPELGATVSEIDIIRFGGRGLADGRIEETGDTDVFRFTATSHEIATITVTSLSPLLAPAVFVYEVSGDPFMNTIFLKIGQDRDGGSDTADTVFSTTPNRDYYIIVRAAEPEVGFGDYQVLVDLRSTDDHPNLDELPIATAIPIDYDAGTGFGEGAVTGEIEVQGDNDLFRFTSPRTGEAMILVDTPDSGLAMRIRIIDADTGETFELPDGSMAVSEGAAGFATLTLPEEVFIEGREFFLLVEGGTTGTGQPDLFGSYSITITTSPADDHADEGDLANATVLTLDQAFGTASASGLIYPAADSDLFTFTTLATGRVRINLTTPVSSLAPAVRVLAANGTTVVATSQGNGDTASVEFSATAPNQRYYIVVVPATGVMNQTGTYTLSVQGNTGVDDHANATEWGDATAVALDVRKADGLATGTINFSADTDLFTFTALDTGPARVQVLVPAGTPLNASVRIFSSTFQQIAFNSQGIPGSTAQLQFNATGGQQYFVLVEPEEGTQGDYTLRLDTEPEVHYLYHPEGFTSDAISEFIPLVNPNSFAVNYTIIARYEVGDRDQVIATGTIQANSRGGITINDRFDASKRLVRPDTPYALEIQSDGPLGATLSHYDFGITTGENFTDTLSTTWTFAEAHRDPSIFRDFLVFYNPNNQSTIVHVKQVYENGAVNEFDFTLDAFRRGGVNFTTNDQVDLDGRFGLVVTANVPIVAALTSFDISANRGYGLLGEASQGATEGVVPMLTADDGVEAGLSIFNSGSTPAQVNIRSMYSRVDLPDIIRNFTVAPNSTLRLTDAQLGLVRGQTAAIRYTSNVPVTVNAFEFQNGDGDATAAATAAGTTFLFGDAFVNPAFAGITYIENLGIFNPTNVDTTINLTFLFTDGTTATSSVTVNANDFAHISIDQQPAILNRVAPTAFSLKVDASVPVLASFVHYDLFLNGGWSAIGSPIGFTNAVATV